MDHSASGHPHGAVRRTDREMTDRGAIDRILQNEKIMHLGMSDGAMPLVLPLFYAYDGTAMFFHSARAGAKVGILERNPNVCFEVMSFAGVIESEHACDFEARHQTVVGFGTAHFIEDEDEKVRHLDAIVARFTERRFAYPPERVRGVFVVRIDITAITGKQHGF